MASSPRSGFADDELDLPELDLPEALYDYFAGASSGDESAVQRGLSQLGALGVVTHELATALLGAGAAEILSEGVRIGAVTRSGSEFELHPLLSEFLITQLQDDPDSGLKKMAADAMRLLVAERKWDQAFHVIWSLKTSHLLPDLLTVALDDLLQRADTDCGPMARPRRGQPPHFARHRPCGVWIGFREGLYKS